MGAAKTALTTIGGALMALLFFTSAQAENVRDVSAAPPGASACLGCHGATPTALPSLSDLSARDIETAMNDYRSGTREATLMNRIARGFTPDESRAIALWLAAKK
jgi:cytochrome c553